MRALLRADYFNGHFGDPALYVWQLNGRDAMLFDCGDLSRFSTRQLLRVNRIFLSHCHIDHFFGFDLFLRVHVGFEKKVEIFGPPDTAARVGGKLQGYTWNLIRDQNLEFVVRELHPADGVVRTTRFHAERGFEPFLSSVVLWNPDDPIVDVGIYKVHAVILDHRTPSVAYAIEEKPSVAVDAARMDQMGLAPGPWIEKLKSLFLFGGLKGARIEVTGREGEIQSPRYEDALFLSQELLIPQHRNKIAYVTDGAATAENAAKIGRLVQSADLLFCETCFVEADRDHAEATQHFTASYMGSLAASADVKAIFPIHFSKRYLDRPEIVIKELKASFSGRLATILPSPRIERR